MARLGVRLSDETLEKWNTYCAGRGLKPGTAVRHAIEQQVATLETEPVHSTVPPGASEGDQKKVRVSIWLTESECGAVDKRVLQHGGTRANWLIRLIRAALTQEPQLADPEIEALTTSSYQLDYIGRNLSKISRHLEAGAGQGVELKSINELAESIKSHTDSVDQLIRSNTERWSIK